jgi:hypothetical protein
MARMTSSVLLAAISRYAVIRRVLGLHRVGSVAEATAAEIAPLDELFPSTRKRSEAGTRAQRPTARR